MQDFIFDSIGTFLIYQHISKEIINYEQTLPYKLKALLSILIMFIMCYVVMYLSPFLYENIPEFYEISCLIGIFLMGIVFPITFIILHGKIFKYIERMFEFYLQFNPPIIVSCI